MSTATELTAATNAGPVHYRVRERVAVLVIDNPPVNASSAAVRSGLLAGISRATTDPAVDAVVLIGSGRNFVSGSDLKEFAGSDLPKPELPEVISAVEGCPKPVVAAISGATLGGGLELALGCDWRIALENSTVGLPETTLGVIPGAGGAQRLMRLIGPELTIELVAHGTRHRLTSENHLGIVDRMTAGDLEEEAVRFAKEGRGKRLIINQPVPEWLPGKVEDAAIAAIKASKGSPQVIAAVGAVLAGISLASDRALVFERAEFTRLRNGPEAAALRYQFFARREALKSNDSLTPGQLSRVVVIGAGTMGMGIARAFLDAGAAVILYDENESTLIKATERLHEVYDRMVGSGSIDKGAAEAGTARIATARNLDELRGADLYIEAVFEDLDVKKSVLARLEPLAGDAPLATNTSYLDVNELAGVLAAPEKLVGMHFFSPAHRTPVLEIVKGRATGAGAMAAAYGAARMMGKTPIISAVCEGFIGNRVYNAYRRQCELLLEEGAMPAQVDAALTGFGFAMGPFAVADMSGLDIAWRIRQSKAATRDPAERYPDVADSLCELGRLGQKTGRGWYQYGDDKRKPLPDPDVEQLILASSQRKGLARRAFTAEEIVRRALLAMANETALLLGEGVAARPADVDLMLVLGYGFPAHRGGIAYWASHQDHECLVLEQEQLAQLTGPGFRRGDLSRLWT